MSMHVRAFVTVSVLTTHSLSPFPRWRTRDGSQRRMTPLFGNRLRLSRRSKLPKKTSPRPKALRVPTKMFGGGYPRSSTRPGTSGRYGNAARPKIAQHSLDIGCLMFSSSWNGFPRNVARTSRQRSSRCAPHRTLRATSRSNPEARRVRGARTISRREHRGRARRPIARAVRSLRARIRVAPVPTRHGRAPVMTRRVVRQ